ncbi:hypothetical protein [Mycobacterium adipatum]|nr:hypothetical protein [Mycobacterium adipatum]MBI5737143.1 hypothetical protein [Mycolicibacterium neoaurum]
MAPPLRVIQWATGNVGSLALAADHEQPDLELVGAPVCHEAGTIPAVCDAEPGWVTHLDRGVVRPRRLVRP